jgi:hypothetical protein
MLLFILYITPLNSTGANLPFPIGNHSMTYIKEREALLTLI